MGLSSVSNDVVTQPAKKGITVVIKDSEPIDIATQLSQPLKAKEEKADNETKKEEKSLWENVKNWLKNPFNAAGVTLTGLGATALVVMALTSNPIFASAGIFGLFALIAGGCSMWQGYEFSEKAKCEAIAKEHLAEMAKNKAAEKDTKALDATDVKAMETLYGKPENLVAFKTKDGIKAEKAQIPEAVKMNKLLEKYSTEDSPEITQQELVELSQAAKQLFAEVKEKAQKSFLYDNREYAFGTYDGKAAAEVVSKKEKDFGKLIAAYTGEDSAGGKNIDKSELIELRAQAFRLLNEN